jgi:hypothetical protein
MVTIALTAARISRPFSLKAISISPASMLICDWKPCTDGSGGDCAIMSRNGFTSSSSAR